MIVVDTTAGLAAAAEEARAAGRSVGLVPTMGALHAGHRSLIERAVAENDVVAVTVFVNPLQFGDPSDIAHYPRTLEADLEVCAGAGAHLVFAPSVGEMYPDHPLPPATTVSVSGVTGSWEGASRPGHFDGVATVVTKLFAMAGRCRAYFGEKDFQQLAVVRTLVADLCLPVTVVGCPTVREPDGLALSSRNVRLSPEERTAALALPRSLEAGRAALAAGARTSADVVAAMYAELAGQALVRPDYAAVVRPGDLTVPDAFDESTPLRLVVAADVGPVRLIDNCDGWAPSVLPPSVAGGARSVRTAVGSSTTVETHTRETRTTHETLHGAVSGPAAAHERRDLVTT